MSLLSDKAGQREAWRKPPWGHAGSSEEHFGRDDTSAWSGKGAREVSGRTMQEEVGSGPSRESFLTQPKSPGHGCLGVPGFAHLIRERQIP